MAHIEATDPNGYKPNQEIFSEILQELATTDRDIIAVTNPTPWIG